MRKLAHKLRPKTLFASIYTGVFICIGLALLVTGTVYTVPQLARGSLFNATNSSCQYDDKELCRFINQHSSIKPFNVQTETTAKSGVNNTASLAFAADNRTTFKLSVDGATKDERIYIGDTLYLKSGDKWQQQVVKVSEQDILRDQYNFNQQAAKSGKVFYKKVGKEACGNRTCYKYRVSLAEHPNTYYIWFDTKDYLLRRMRLERVDGAVSESNYSYSIATINAPPASETVATAANTSTSANGSNASATASGGSASAAASAGSSPDNTPVAWPDFDSSDFNTTFSSPGAYEH